MIKPSRHKAITIPTAWVGFVDIYGFSALLRQSDSANTYKKLETYQKKAIAILQSCPQAYFFLFSDSLLFSVPSRDSHYDAFKELNQAIQKIYFEAVKLEFMLRGAVTFGEVRVASHYILGEPLLRAVEVEKELSLPIICGPTADLQKAGISEQTGILPELLPTKRGYIQGMDLVRMPFDLITATIDRYLQEASIHGPQEVAAVWVHLKERIAKTKNRSRDIGDGQATTPTTD